jgi:hypothetical protein
MKAQPTGGVDGRAPARPRWPQVRRKRRVGVVPDQRHEAARAASWAKGLGKGYATPVLANLPRSVLRNRASVPFVLISW